MTAIALGPRGHYGILLAESGASDLAARLAQNAQRRVANWCLTAYGQQRVVNSASDLAASVEEARELEAFGEAVVPTAAALKEAHELIDSLPKTLPRPHIAIEPSGAIGFEWETDRDRFAILALKGTGVLEYAIGTGPGDRQWGTRNFAGSLDERTLRDLAAAGVSR